MRSKIAMHLYMYVYALDFVSLQFIMRVLNFAIVRWEAIEGFVKGVTQSLYFKRTTLNDLLRIGDEWQENGQEGLVITLDSGDDLWHVYCSGPFIIIKITKRFTITNPVHLNQGHGEGRDDHMQILESVLTGFSVGSVRERLVMEYERGVMV